jgi:hypothetical protein
MYDEAYVVDNELPCEDFAVPSTLKTIKELLWAEEDHALQDYLDDLPEDTKIRLWYNSNNDLESIQIVYNIEGE